MKILALGLAVLTILVVTALLAFLPQPALAQTAITTCTELHNIRNNLGGDYYLAIMTLTALVLTTATGKGLCQLELGATNSPEPLTGRAIR